MPSRSGLQRSSVGSPPQVNNPVVPARASNILFDQSKVPRLESISFRAVTKSLEERRFYLEALRLHNQEELRPVSALLKSSVLKTIMTLYASDVVDGRTIPDNRLLSLLAQLSNPELDPAGLKPFSPPKFKLWLSTLWQMPIVPWRNLNSLPLPAWMVFQ